MSIAVVYMSIPIFQSLPHPLFPLGAHTFMLYICISISVLQIRLFIPLISHFVRFCFFAFASGFKVLAD